MTLLIRLYLLLYNFIYIKLESTVIVYWIIEPLKLQYCPNLDLLIETNSSADLV